LMDSAQIRQKFLDFFESKGHKIVPSSPLVTDDPSVLFTTAGMQQFKPYYLGARDPMKDFGSKSTASVQKSVRTSDIEEVGDERHLTFFEMLGNFSFGGYWKEEAIKYAHEFVTKEMGLKIDYVTIFKGEEGVPRDDESEKIWKSIDSNIDVREHDRADNFWGPTGEEGPCGPTTEIYVDGIEIWNIVFNEFYQGKDKTLKPLDIKGIDTGMGLERLAMVSQDAATVFDTDLFKGIMDHAKLVSNNEKSQRIISDHFRASVFMIADGVTPSNTERGYVLRRLIRRAIVKSVNRNIDAGNISTLVNSVVGKYGNFLDYKNLSDKQGSIKQVIQEEAEKFQKTLESGLKEFGQVKTINGVPLKNIKSRNGVPIENIKSINGLTVKTKLNGSDVFNLFSTYGFPLELTIELAEERGLEVDVEGFKEEFSRHQESSKAGAEQKFKGGLAGHSEIEIKYHTATHLLHQALRDVLGSEVEQKGSNITPERLRFDFAFPRKMTDEEKKRVEDIVNDKIKAALPVEQKIMKKEEAISSGALHFFDQKYPDEVSVYSVGDYSKEFCGGPHVSNTSELGDFRIQKEEAVSAGVRRIKAVLQ
jgi:alanyl-tRNA synthetase